MISAVGNDSRRPGSVGKVWTITPREARRTTRKRWSAMRRLANGFEQLSRGVILGVTNDGHADAEPSGNRAVRHGLGGGARSLGAGRNAPRSPKHLDARFRRAHARNRAGERRDSLAPGIFSADGSC